MWEYILVVVWNSILFCLCAFAMCVYSTCVCCVSSLLHLFLRSVSCVLQLVVDHVSQVSVNYIDDSVCVFLSVCLWCRIHSCQMCHILILPLSVYFFSFISDWDYVIFFFSFWLLCFVYYLSCITPCGCQLKRSGVFGLVHMYSSDDNWGSAYGCV